MGTITVGELVQQLQMHDDDAEVVFGLGDGTLSYYRVKGRRAKLVQIEFNEQVHKVAEFTVESKG